MTRALILCMLVGCIAVAARAQEDNRELHVVVAYNARLARSARFGEPVVKVHRPGKRVTLVLSGYYENHWRVSASKETQIEKVLAGGYQPQLVAGVPEKLVRELGGYGYSRFPESIDDLNIRNAVRELHAGTGLQITSYQGAQWSAGPFVVDKVDADERLRFDYPQPVQGQKLPKLSFRAVHSLVIGNRWLASSYGDFTLAGPVEDSLRPIPCEGKNSPVGVACDSDGKQFLSVADRSVQNIDFEQQSSKEVGEKISWPRGVAFDSQRKRFVVLGGSVHQYSQAEDKWTVLGKANPNWGCVTLAWSAPRDCLYTLKVVKMPIMLAKFDADGKFVSEIELQGPLFRGVIPEAGFFSAQLIPVDDYLVLITHPVPDDALRLHTDTLIYLIDPDNGNATLTAHY